MRTDTRTLKEKIADRDAKRGRNHRAGSHPGLVRNPRLWARQAQAFAPATLTLCAQCDLTCCAIQPVATGRCTPELAAFLARRF